LSSSGPFFYGMVVDGWVECGVGGWVGRENAYLAGSPVVVVRGAVSMQVVLGVEDDAISGLKAPQQTGLVGRHPIRPRAQTFLLLLLPLLLLLFQRGGHAIILSSSFPVLLLFFILLLLLLFLVQLLTAKVGEGRDHKGLQGVEEGGLGRRVGRQMLEKGVEIPAYGDGVGSWVAVGCVSEMPWFILPGGPQVHVREQKVCRAHFGNGLIPRWVGGRVGG